MLAASRLRPVRILDPGVTDRRRGSMAIAARFEPQCERFLGSSGCERIDRRRGVAAGTRELAGSASTAATEQGRAAQRSLDRCPRCTHAALSLCPQRFCVDQAVRQVLQCGRLGPLGIAGCDCGHQWAMGREDSGEVAAFVRQHQ
jgi:hypothetical protein